MPITATPDRIPDEPIPMPTGDPNTNGTDMDLFRRYCSMLRVCGDPIRLKMVIFIHNNPGCGLEDICQGLGIHRTTGHATYHLRQLRLNQIIALTKTKNFGNIRQTYTLEKIGDFGVSNVRIILNAWSMYRIQRPFGT